MRPFTFPSYSSWITRTWQVLVLPVICAVFLVLHFTSHDPFAMVMAALVAGGWLACADELSYLALAEQQWDAALECGCMACLRAAGA